MLLCVRSVHSLCELVSYRPTPYTATYFGPIVLQAPIGEFRSKIHLNSY